MQEFKSWNVQIDKENLKLFLNLGSQKSDKTCMYFEEKPLKL